MTKGIKWRLLAAGVRRGGGSGGWSWGGDVKVQQAKTSPGVLIAKIFARIFIAIVVMHTVRAGARGVRQYLVLRMSGSRT